ncbi:MAG: hypothetical protein ACI8RP_001414 [Urechidicola sp.]|jgi:hypothetical protein
MIKFFRKIRFDLMEKDKTGKYFKYAISEIILVVIGILIAVSINNWNENRKEKGIETASLTDIRKDLIQTKEDLTNNIKAHKSQSKIYNELLYNLKKTQVYNDSLASKFSQLIYWTSPYLTLATYENIKLDKGIEIISKDSLKNQIINLHEKTFKTFIGDIEREEWLNTETISRPTLLKYFYFIDQNNVVPKDYDSLVTNKDFLSILNFTIDLRKRSLQATEYNNNEISIVIDAITTELNK